MRAHQIYLHAYVIILVYVSHTNNNRCKSMLEINVNWPVDVRYRLEMFDDWVDLIGGHRVGRRWGRQQLLHRFLPAVVDSVEQRFAHKSRLLRYQLAYQLLYVKRWFQPGADLTGGHSCSGRRGPWVAGPWRPRASGSRKAKFGLIVKSWLQLELNLWFI